MVGVRERERERTEEEVVEAPVGEVRIDEHLLSGGGTTAEQRDQITVLDFKQKPDLINELLHPLSRL